MNDVCICEECIYNCLSAQGLIPPGGVYCFKCKSVTEGFILKYPSHVKLKWVFSGFDSHEQSIYTIKAVTGRFTPGKDLPNGCECLTCGYDTPLWMLNHNKYVQQAHHP